MATIRNTIDTQFTSRGARGVQQDTENVGRAQTRMGQASAGAGRSFAAQSQGLGGLVGAYAGAAATVFALEAAFTALAKSAQAETIVTGTSALASGIAQSGPKIIKSIQEITQGQLTMAEAAQNANIGLSAGFDSTQIEGLTKVAMGASRALGRNLTDSLQRVFRGVAKLEPELLDELGIFVRIEPAVNAYARKLGVAAKSLSQFERGQAFANAAIEEGTRKFGMIDVSAPSAQKSLEQLNTKVMELALEFGQLLTQVLLPFVNFLKNDAGNALVLFGGIILLVFSKALTMIGAFTMGGITKFTVFADSFIAKTGSMKAAIDALNVSQQTYMANLGRAGTAGMTGAVTGASSADRARQLGGMGFAAGTLDRTGRFDSVAGRKDGAAGTSTAKMRKEATAARRAFIAGELKTERSVRKARDALVLMNTTLRATSQASQQATVIIQALSAAQTNMGKSAMFASRALGLLKTAAAGVGAFLGGMMSVLSGLFMLFAVLDLAGMDIFSKIKDFFVDNSQSAKNMESAVTGAFAAMGDGAAALTKDLKAIGATDKDLENVSKEVNALNSSLVDESNTRKKNKTEATNLFNDRVGQQELGVNTIAVASAINKSDAIEQLIKGIQDEISTVGQAEGNKGDVSTALEGLKTVFKKLRTTNDLRALEATLKNLQKPIDSILSDAEFNQDQIKQVVQTLKGILDPTKEGTAVKQLLETDLIAQTTQEVSVLAVATERYAKVQERLKEITQMSDSERAKLTKNEIFNLQKQEIFLKRSVELATKLDQALLPVAGSLGRITGMRLDTLVGMFSGVETLISDAGSKLTLFGIEIDKIEGAYSFELLSDDFKELAESALISSAAIRQANNDFTSGATTVDKLSAVIAGAEGQYKKIGATLNKQGAIIQDAFYEIFVERLDDLKRFREELRETEATYKGLTKTFSKESKFLETLRFGGKISTENAKAGVGLDQAQVEFLQGLNEPQGASDVAKELNLPVLSEELSELARSSNDAKKAQFALLATIGDKGGKYRDAVEKVKRYNAALEAGATKTELYAKGQNTIGPDANEIQQNEAFMEAADVVLGILLEQGITAAEINDKLNFRLKLAREEQNLAMKTLDIQRKQVDMEAARAAFTSTSAATQATIQGKQLDLSVKQTIIALDEMGLQSDIAKIRHEGALAEAKSSGANQAAHRLRMKGLKDELILMRMQSALADLENNNLRGPNDIKNARIAIIKQERKAIVDNHKLQLAAIRSQAGASAKVRAAELKAIKAEIEARATIFNETTKEMVANFSDQEGSGMSATTGRKGNVYQTGRMLPQPDKLVTGVLSREPVRLPQPSIPEFYKAQQSEMQKDRELRYDIFVMEKDLFLAKVTHDADMASQAEEIQKQANARVTLQRTLEDTKIQNDRDVEDAQNSFVDNFLLAVDNFGDFVDIFATKTMENLKGEGKAFDVNKGRTVINDARTRIATTGTNRVLERDAQDAALTALRSKEDGINTAKLTSLTAQKDAADALLRVQERLVEKQKDNFFKQLYNEAVKEQFELEELQRRLELTEASGGAAQAEIQNQINEAQADYVNSLYALDVALKAADRELTKFDTDMGAVRDTLDAELIDGFQNLGDVLLGVNQETKSFATAIENTFRQLMRSIIQEIQMQMISKPLAGMASSFITGALTGGLSSTPIPFNEAAVLTGGLYAAGGSVRHMADGGQVNALRDRVPAMLEPGEFVIRKNSAKSIGRSKLGQMNATGSAGMGNVEFNIVNQGSPKQAEQQGMPKFDTDKLVIDVVMRDLENNGPIRKALRS